MSTPIHALRIDDETWGRWVAEAQKRKLNMSDFIRKAVEDSLGHRALLRAGPTGPADADAVDRSVAARTLPIKRTPYTPNDLAGPVTPDPRPTKKK